ncbi:MAG: sigma-54 dependent transcriptional regulator [Desulfobacterales bacterium]
MGKAVEILIIDDDDLVLASLSDYLTTKDFRVSTAATAREGIAQFERRQPPIVLLDQNLPDGSGLNLCRQILQTSPKSKIIFITGYATVQYAVDAMRAGAFHYLSKPFELEELLIAIEFACKNISMEDKLRVRDYQQAQARGAVRLVGDSPLMGQLREQISLAAASQANVLITGETGVGKNVVAQAIHDAQNQRETLLSINCSAIPENLMEAEYFGHEKGIFTGADHRREGIFELAHGGTLVLDEVGDIPIHLQSKLLSVLEEKQIRRIGGSRTIPVDVRIIAATNQDLETAIESNRFRRDLFYRLAVFTIHVPPLREHVEDIPALAAHFLGQLRKTPTHIAQADLERLKAYAWPGNVRELRNVIERATIIFPGESLPAAQLLGENPKPNPGVIPAAPPLGSRPTGIEPLEGVVRDHIRNAMALCENNKSETARRLGLSLSTLKRKLKTLDIS